MKIGEINANSMKITVQGKIIEKQETREINTKFGQTKVANAVIEDETGTCVLVLWGDDADKVSEGDNIKIENGYVKEWNGSLQLQVGKFGKLTKV